MVAALVERMLCNSKGQSPSESDKPNDQILPNKVTDEQGLHVLVFFFHEYCMNCKA